MEKKEMLYEGKAKKVYATDVEDVYIVDYKDDATAFNGEKKGTIVGKGVINNRMTNFLFQKLEKAGVPTHFVEELSDRETAVKKVKIIPLEVIVRNTAAGSFSKRLGIEEGKKLLCPPWKSTSPVPLVITALAAPNVKTSFLVSTLEARSIYSPLCVTFRMRVSYFCGR